MRHLTQTSALALLLAAPFAGGALAADLSIVAGSTGNDLQVLREELDQYQEKSGNKVDIVSMPSSTTDQFAQYRLWLSAQNQDIDVYWTDVIWAPQLAEHFVDLSGPLAEEMKQNIPQIVQSQTVDGKLVAAPMYTDAPALYYRKDLLDKHGKKVPETWTELEQTAKEVMDAERAGGASDQFWGFVFQGAAYEGLTCDALEWIKSNGGGQIISPDGEITVNNEKAAQILDKAKGWVGTIAPPGVLAYQEEESRGVWQTGNAVFMRNWPYAYSLSQAEDSAVKGKFDATTLPRGEGGESGAATLGGWNLAVSNYSQDQDAAIDLVKFLISPEIQKKRAIENSKLPTIASIYDDPDVKENAPLIAKWKDVVLNAVPRPSAPTKGDYNEVSKEFWSAVHETLSGTGSAEKNLAVLEKKLKRLRGRGW
ncbi:MAG: ABC transporter substrate-binding protein [Geminicoccaceae bacterium]|nr:ABC transporter substrate-binding protein [Geminicoccaceae bacterium]